MMAVDIQTGQGVTAGVPHALFQTAMAATPVGNTTSAPMASDS